jgi:hypothetical protein
MEFFDLYSFSVHNLQLLHPLSFNRRIKRRIEMQIKSDIVYYIIILSFMTPKQL